MRLQSRVVAALLVGGVLLAGLAWRYGQQPSGDRSSELDGSGPSVSVESGGDTDPRVAPRPAPVAGSSRPEGDEPPRIASPTSASAEEAAASLEPSSPRTYVIRGILQDTGGRPVEVQAGSIDCYDEVGRLESIPFSGREFVLPGLHAGSWTWHVASPGFRKARGTIELAGSEPVRLLRVTLEERPQVTVRLTTPQGEGWMDLVLRQGLGALPRLNVVATRFAPELNESVDLGADGNLLEQIHRQGRSGSLLEEAPPDVLARVTLHADPPLHLSLVLWDLVLATVELTEPRPEVEFVLDPEDVLGARGGLRGRVISSLDGAPVGRARLDLAGPLGLVPTEDTDLEGRFEMTGLEPTTWSLVVVAEGFAKLPCELEVPQGGVLDLGDLRLEPPVTLEADLLGPGGQPLALDVWVRRLDAPGSTPDPWLRVRMLRPGSLREDGLVAGRFRLEPAPPVLSREAPWTFRPVVVDLPVSSSGPVEIPVVRGARLTLQPGARAISYALHPPPGPGAEPAVWEGRLSPGVPVQRYVAPGAWMLIARELSGGRAVRRELDLGPAGLTVDLDPR